jgi:phosphatidylethanolamine-binding protein (PEBP) family uncharacterized protein
MSSKYSYQSMSNDSIEELGNIQDANEERSISYKKIGRNVIFATLTVFAVMMSVSFMQSHYETTSTNLSTTDTSLPFTLSSSAFVDNSTLPDMYTCKTGIGLGISPQLSWSNVPEGTVEFYVAMSKVSGYDWSVYAIPATEVGLLADNEHMGYNGTMGVGKRGGTEKKFIDAPPYTDISDFLPKYYYDEPCSSGPGSRWYEFTVYAFDTKIVPVMDALGLNYTPSFVLESMQDHFLGQSSLLTHFTLYD